jgi:hypothetical protein
MSLAEYLNNPDVTIALIILTILVVVSTILVVTIVWWKGIRVDQKKAFIVRTARGTVYRFGNLINGARTVSSNGQPPLEFKWCSEIGYIDPRTNIKSWGKVIRRRQMAIRFVDRQIWVTERVTKIQRA